MAELALRWRHNGRNGVSNHQPRDCLLNGLFGQRSKKTSKLRVIGLGAGNSPGTGEFPAQMASNAENVSIWWRHHGASCPHGTVSNWFNNCSSDKIPYNIKGFYETVKLIPIIVIIGIVTVAIISDSATMVLTTSTRTMALLLYMGQVMKLRLSCYLVLLSIDSKNR